MTAQAGYAGYSSWYQVGSQFLAQSKAQDASNLLSNLFLQSTLREFAEYEKLFDSFSATTVRQLRLSEHLELQPGILSSQLEKATLTVTPKYENRKQFEPKTTCQLNNELELPAGTPPPPSSPFSVPPPTYLTAHCPGSVVKQGVGLCPVIHYSC